MKKVWWVIILGILIAYAAILLDPDYGLHIRMGEYIAHNGIPVGDPLSYTMANYTYIYHEWLAIMGMWWLENNMGRWALVIIFAGMGWLALRLAIPERARRWALAPTLLMLAVVIPRFGVRLQVVDWLLLIITIKLFGEEGKWEKWQWIFPALMMGWANIHGGFPLGVVGSAVVIGVKKWEEKKLAGKEWIIWILGVGATLINPYGLRIWELVTLQLTDKYASKVIAEWQPFYVTVELAYAMMWGLFLGLEWNGRRQRSKWREIIAMGVGIASLGSLRHGALFALTAGGVIADKWQYFYDNLKDGTTKKRAEKFYNLLCGISGVVIIVSVGMSFVTVSWMREGGYYPTAAVEYLRKNEIKGNIMADYGLGGYMGWKLPERKVFIDGRMESWRWKSPDPAQADYIFEDYLKIMGEGKYEEAFEKYNVGTVMLNKPRPQIIKTGIGDWLNKWGEFKTESNNNILKEKLEKNGWRVVYEDKSVVIYEDKEN